MKRTTFANWPCGIARTTDLMGDWWTPLIVREAMYGSTKFDEFERALRLSRNILTQRLNRLVEAGIFEKSAYQQRPVRHEYRLTEQGWDLTNVLLVEFAWGNRWLAPLGAPVTLVDRDSGEPIDPVVVDRTTGRPIDARSIGAAVGPGFPSKLRNHPVVVERFGRADYSDEFDRRRHQNQNQHIIGESQ